MDNLYRENALFQLVENGVHHIRQQMQSLLWDWSKDYFPRQCYRKAWTNNTAVACAGVLLSGATIIETPNSVFRNNTESGCTLLLKQGQRAVRKCNSVTPLLSLHPMFVLLFHCSHKGLRNYPFTAPAP